MTNLTPATKARIHKLFPPGCIGQVEALLMEECGQQLPLVQPENTDLLERIHFAALKRSQGDLDKLLDAIMLAQTDWRDLLMAAGFADSLTAHKDWLAD